MLFNSTEFIFAFLPATLVGFYLLGSVSRAWALRWLILASLFFYAWWRPLNLLLIAPSIAINYALARTLQRLAEIERYRRARTAVLLLGIAFNVAFLGYFKYTNFVFGAINDALGTGFVLREIILPLGLSFITFQKIAFLVDVHAGRVKTVRLADYCLFVLFFPQLIAGPIVHYREMMPQFHAASCRFDRENVAVGLTLFFFGLFKKVVIADSIAGSVSAIYRQAAGGESISLLMAWMAAVGFTLQIYFDFAGYSDMALGIARFFGIRLPANFDSPLRASSIIEFWLHWHMTLTRFLTAYIYNPLVLALTRRRLARGQPGFSGRNATVGAFAQLLMFPTMLTMFVSGLWHGAGYLFLVWGLLHGAYLTLNHGWRLIAPRIWSERSRLGWATRPVSVALTFVAVAVSMVFFRSETVGSAVDLLRGMAGLNGVALPESVFDHLGPLKGLMQTLHVTSQPWSGADFVTLALGIPALLFIALACPNTLQMLSRYQPALGVKARAIDGRTRDRLLDWSPSLRWAIAMSAIVAIAVALVSGESEFLYWQF
jgi:alginate O-acetyltransferase complex protein AlgI